MALGTLLLATAVGGGTYLYAKSKEASSGTAAVAGVATGAGTAAAAMLLSVVWPVLLVVGVVGVPAYLIGKSRNGPKALGPGRDY
jgi:hypothetical protein